MWDGLTTRPTVERRDLPFVILKGGALKYAAT